MTPTEVKQSADEMVDMFTKIIWESGNTVSKPMIIDVCIAHCKRVIEAFEVLNKDLDQVYQDIRTPVGISDCTNKFRNTHRLILSELEGRVK